MRVQEFKTREIDGLLSCSVIHEFKLILYLSRFIFHQMIEIWTNKARSCRRIFISILNRITEYTDKLRRKTKKKFSLCFQLDVCTLCVVTISLHRYSLKTLIACTLENGILDYDSEYCRTIIILKYFVSSSILLLWETFKLDILSFFSCWKFVSFI